VLEEIVGEVQDEFDQERPAIAAAGEGKYRISGSARVEELARILGEERELAEVGAEVDTVAGYVQDRLGRIARAGDEVPLGSYLLHVEEVRGNRILRLTAMRLPPAPAPECEGKQL
jgi:putative hemolysin